MTPARTSGLKQRPMTAPARATSRASADSLSSRTSTASPMVSGTCASRMRRPSARASSSSAASSSSMWSGNAVRPLVDGLDHVARRRQLAAQDQRRGDAGLVDRQRSQPDLLGVPLAEDARPPLAVDAVGGELVAAVVGRRAAAADRPRGGPARRSPPGSSRRSSAGPRRSASTADRWPPGSDPPPRGRSGAAPPAHRRRGDRRSRAGPPTGFPTGHRHASRWPSRGSRRAGPGGPAAPRSRRPPAARPLRPSGPPRGSGGSCRDRRGRRGRRRCRDRVRVGDQLIEELEKVVAADQDGALNGTGAAHGAQSTPRHPSSRIGRMTDGFPRGRRRIGPDIGRSSPGPIGHAHDDALTLSPTLERQQPAAEELHGQVHGRPHRLHRRDGPAAEGGARARPRDRGRRGRPFRARLARPGARQGLLPCHRTDPHAVIRIHERAGHPTQEIYELTVEV